MVTAIMVVIMMVIASIISVVFGDQIVHQFLQFGYTSKEFI